MSCVDVAIVGGGLSGSTAAAMLGRAGISAVLIDVHQAYPTDFRAEKIVDSQIPLLQRTGLAEEVLSAATADEEVWIARFGRLVETRRHDQYNILYDTLVFLPAGLLIGVAGRKTSRRNISGVWMLVVAWILPALLLEILLAGVSGRRIWAGNIALSLFFGVAGILLINADRRFKSFPRAS